MKSRIQFPEAPEKSIQELCLSGDGKILAASCWDSAIYLYDTNYVKLLEKIELDRPSLYICFESPDLLIIGLSDGRVVEFSIEEKTQKELYKHQECVRYVHCNENLIFSCGYDEIATLYNTETGVSVKKQLPARPFAAYFCSNYYVALSNRTVVVISPDNEIVKEFESPLRHETRSIIVNDKFIILASVEGRIAVLDKQYENVYAFRAHKLENESFPVNALLFSKGNLLSAGSDGKLYIWDLDTRKKIYKIGENYGISTMCSDAENVYIAKSYNWENSEAGQKGEEIAIIAYKLSDMK